MTMFLHLKVKPNPRLLISHKHFKVQSNFFLRSEGMKLSIENTSDISIHRYIYIRRSTDICIHILQNPSLNSLQVLLKNSLYLVGLGETYLNQARSALQQDFSGKAVDCVMEAINVLARLVLADVLVVSHIWFTLYFCTVIMAPFLNILTKWFILTRWKTFSHALICKSSTVMIMTSASHVLFTVIEGKNEAICFDTQLVFSHLSCQPFSLAGCCE